MNVSATLGLDNTNFMNGMGAATGSLGQLLGGLRGLVGPLAGFAAGFAAVAGAAQAASAAVKDAAQMEDFQTSFVTLLGSVDAAKERMADLAKFAADTPFELPEISRASRTLETLTRGALSTGEGLRLVGDVAASTQQPFGDLAVVIGRLYDGLDSGRPVGEALMRLQELGAISGEVRGRIEALQSEGAKGESVWRVATEAIGRFSGEMDRKSQTFNGRASSMADAWSGLSRELGSPIMEVAKDHTQRLTLILEESSGALRDAKIYWGDLLGVVSKGGAAGLEVVDSLLKQARAVETLTQKQEMLAAMERELARLRDRADKAPTLDFSQAIAQVERLLAYMAKIPDAALAAAEAQQDAVTRLANIEKNAPEWNTGIDTASRAMLDARDRQGLRDTNADPIDRQIAAITLAQRATMGVLAEPPQNLEQAKERLEQEMELVEQMRKQPELLGLAAQKAEGIAKAYEEILSLMGSVNGIVKQSVEDSVRDLIAEIYKPANPAGETEPASRRDLASITSDRLAKLGGFIGGAGGPATEYARRSAVANERMAKLMERLSERPLDSGPQVAVWG